MPEREGVGEDGGGMGRGEGAGGRGGEGRREGVVTRRRKENIVSTITTCDVGRPDQN